MDNIAVGAPAHIRVATPVIIVGLIVCSLVSALCVGGGIVAIIWNATSPTTANLFGTSLTTGHVGVAFVFIGLVVLGLVIRKAFKILVELGRL
jgi:hypothetical protein